jgi:hypothetical protein
MPALVDYLARSSDPLKRGRLQKQWAEAVESAVITCCCGQRRALTHAYRCLYCGEWYCTTCAEIHFGKTLAEFREV